MLTVVVHEKGGQTQRIAFHSDQFSVGREDDNDLSLDRPNISKHHFRLRRSEGSIQVVDLGSTNGTYLNGRRLRDAKAVRRSDRIYFGEFILMLEGDDPALATPVPASASKPSRPPVPSAAASSSPGFGFATAAPDGMSIGAGYAGVEGLLGDRVMTSARRVAAAGTESKVLDQAVHAAIKTVLLNVKSLDPFSPEEAEEGESKRVEQILDRLFEEKLRSGDIAKEVDLALLKKRASVEALALGPLTHLMRDESLREISIVGDGPIRVLRDDGQAEALDHRFSGDLALRLAIQRLAKKWGFLKEGAHVLEGRVSKGFYMYALLPPTPVRTPVLSLRKVQTDGQGLAALVQEGVLSAEMRELIVAAVRGRAQILICASGGVNLDRFMGALVNEVPDDRRVACISDSGQLGAGRPGWIQVRRIQDPADSLSLSDSLGVILRGGLDLLISQRCRHEDAAAVTDALSGAAGSSIVSLWGIDSAHALSRLAALSTVASGAVEALTVALARSVDLIVRLNLGVDGKAMQVIELVEPRVLPGEKIAYASIFSAEKVAGAKIRFSPTGERPLFTKVLARRGISVPDKIFGRPSPTSAARPIGGGASKLSAGSSKRGDKAAVKGPATPRLKR